MSRSTDNLIVELIPKNQRAMVVWESVHNEQRYTPPSHTGKEESTILPDSTTPGPEEIGEDKAAKIELAFDLKPKDAGRGFLFGSNRDVCDVFLGIRDHGISGQAFSMTVDDQGCVLMKTLSRYTISVKYKGQKAIERTQFTWVFLPGKKDIVLVNGRVEFSVEVPRHRHDRSSYIRYRRLFLEAQHAALPALHQLGVDSQAITRQISGPMSPDTSQKPVYQFIKELGRGGLGVVYKVVRMPRIAVFAGKQFGRPTSYQREVKILKKLSQECQEHLVKYVDLWLEDDKPLMVMEYMRGGNLKIQHEKRSLSPEEMTVVFFQSLEALQYLHTRNVIHRDIKPENILFKARTPQVKIKLADFGLAKEGEEANTECGTRPYSAPEVFFGEEYTAAVDIWSLGVTMLYCLNDLPRSRHSHGPLWCEDVVNHGSSLKERQTKHSYIYDEQEILITQHVIGHMLKMRPTERSTAEDCIEEGVSGPFLGIPNLQMESTPNDQCYYDHEQTDLEGYPNETHRLPNISTIGEESPVSPPQPTRPHRPFSPSVRSNHHPLLSSSYDSTSRRAEDEERVRSEINREKLVDRKLGFSASESQSTIRLPHNVSTVKSQDSRRSPPETWHGTEPRRDDSRFREEASTITRARHSVSEYERSNDLARRMRSRSRSPPKSDRTRSRAREAGRPYQPSGAWSRGKQAQESYKSSSKEE